MLRCMGWCIVFHNNNIRDTSMLKSISKRKKLLQKNTVEISVPINATFRASNKYSIICIEAPPWLSTWPGASKCHFFILFSLSLSLNSSVHTFDILSSSSLLCSGFSLPNMAGPFEVICEAAPEHKLGISFPSFFDIGFSISLIGTSPYSITTSPLA